MSGIFAPKDAEGIAPKVDIKEVVRDYLESAAQQPEVKADVPAGLSMEQILSRIDAVIQDSQYIKELFANLGNHREGTNAGNMAIGMGNAVEARENTNQRLLDLLGRMYDDLTGKGGKTLTSDEKKAQERRDDFRALIGNVGVQPETYRMFFDRIFGDKYPERNG